MSKRDKIRLIRNASKSAWRIHLSFKALQLQRFRAFLLSLLNKRVAIDADVKCPLFMLIGAQS